MITGLRRQLLRAAYLWTSIGPVSALARGIRRLLTPVFQSETLVVSNLYINSVSEERERRLETVRGIVVPDLIDLMRHQHQMHPDIDQAYLRRFLAEGGRDRFVLLLAVEREGGTETYVGFRTVEQGFFEMPEFNDAPAAFWNGKTWVGFTATDSSGNTSLEWGTVQVKP
jgi:hypothetical protein